MCVVKNVFSVCGLKIMHGKAALKFIDAKQAQDFFKYKNTERKLYKVNSAIWFNKPANRKV